MGSFIPTQADQEICRNLAKRFSDQLVPSGGAQTYIQQLRSHHGREDLFDGHHHLHRVAHRLAISVTGGPPVPANATSRSRWFHLLRKLLDPRTTKAINTVLKKVLESPSIAYAVFSTQPAQTVLNFELHPGNTGDPVLALDTNGKVFCQVILDCHDDAPLPTPAPNTEPDPPDPETTPEKPIGVRRRKKKKPVKKAKSSKKKAPARKSARKKR
jgi:outer membrane biosynthesis protein TonB